jgi:hypothetical protein
MKKIQVVLEGTGEGLLMHSAQGMVMEKAKKNPAKNYDPEEDAEKVAYRNKEGQLMIPARCVKAAMLNAASWYKFGKKSAKPILAGCTRIEPFELVLTDLKGKALKNYEIDLRPVVVQRARIIRARPKIKEWQLSFDIMYNEELIGTPELIKQILEESGQRIGLLDNRPQKYGENGTFKVVKFAGEKD